MRIEIKSEEHSLRLILPTGLVFTPLGFTVAKGAIKVKGLDLTGLKWKDVRNIKKAVKKCKKANPDWCLVDVESSSGERVRIKL
jgi:hypothetical protein